MTFTAQHTNSSDEGDKSHVTVNVTHGPVSVNVTEHYMHLRSFWGQLGHVLSVSEGKSGGQRAYERYHQHVGGKSLVSGDSLPEWEELREEIRAAWEHSVG